MPSSTLLQRLLSVRQQSEALIAPLEPEDLCLQGMADASPPKWHLAHTTWFFETLCCSRSCRSPQRGSTLGLSVQLLLRGGARANPDRSAAC